MTAVTITISGNGLQGLVHTTGCDMRCITSDKAFYNSESPTHAINTCFGHNLKLGKSFMHVYSTSYINGVNN